VHRRKDKQEDKKTEDNPQNLLFSLFMDSDFSDL